jgi:V/A-type H+-transporting ATPase subunit K
MKRLIIILALLFAAAALFGQATHAADAAEAATVDASTAAWRYIAAALAVGISCIAGGIAVGQIGSAAMGAMSENPELSGKALPYAGLAEGICLWGFLVALLILVIN